jgi:hypothetical protein
MKNEPAFPLLSSAYSDENGFWSGLTKREYFAAAALNGVLAGNNQPNIRFSEDSVAAVAVEYADALIAQLEKSELDSNPPVTFVEVKK